MNTYEKLVAYKIKPHDINTLLQCRNTFKWHKENLSSGRYVIKDGEVWLVDSATKEPVSRLPNWNEWAIDDVKKVVAKYPSLATDIVKAIGLDEI